MKVGDIKENLGESAKDRALRQVALTLNPGQPFVTAGGNPIESFFEFAKLIESEPEELVEHLREPEDGLWDFFEIWGAGAIIEALKPMMGSVKSQKRLVNMMVVALKGNVIMPFEGTRFAGTELSTLGQLDTLPKECQKRFMMELEDQNGLLAVWLEAVSGRGYPKGWTKDGLPEWKEVVGYWNGTYEIEQSPESNKPSATAPATVNKGDMILVKGGTFKMGDTFENGTNDEKAGGRPIMKCPKCGGLGTSKFCTMDGSPMQPRATKPLATPAALNWHDVTLSDYYMSKYQVTFDEYDAFCKATGKENPNDNGWGRSRRPVINVSWYDAVEYCNWRSKKDGLIPAYSGSGETTKCDWQADGYRLPTEAEWEYAARGGRSSKGFKYSGSDDVDNVAWYDDNSEEITHPVGEKAPNELGLHDMSGNVDEWCWDWYGSYSSGAQTNPTGASSGSDRVLRGGGWYGSASDCTVSIRDNFDPSSAYYDSVSVLLPLPVRKKKRKKEEEALPEGAQREPE